MFTRVYEDYAQPAILSLAYKSKLLMLLFTALFVTAPFVAAQGGIGGYDLMSPTDLSFAFDYNSSGTADHLVMYRPGTGVIYILQNTNGVFSPAFVSTSGIGGFDLLSPSDRLFAFDYDGSGYSDHIVAYRPGAGVVYILAKSGDTFSTVYSTSNGIGGYNLTSPDDQMFSFDYAGNGLSDHLVVYRPGTGMVQILQNVSGTFSAVFQSNDGIGGYDLMSTADRMFPFDYTASGVSNHLVAYRPGTGIVFVLSNQNGTFSSVVQSDSGIGGYDLKSTDDQLLPFDYNGNGNLDHILAYRPGTGTIYILQQAYFDFMPVYQSTTGIGGYDLMSPTDRIFSFDYSDTERLDHLVLYRPGTGTIYILGNSSGTFSSVFPSIPSPQMGHGVFSASATN